MEDLKKIKQDGYYLSTPEYALMLGISTEALRSRRRRGELEGQYKTDGEKYWWKSLRPDTVKNIRKDRLYKVRDSSSKIKRKRRRGIHITGQETKYPNYAFQQTNEIRLLNRLKTDLPESVIKEINPEVIKVAKENLEKRRTREHIAKYGPTYMKNYGGPIRGYELQHEYDKQNARRDHQYEAKLQRRKERDNSFFLDNSYRFGNGGAYDFDRTDDPGSVEVSNVQLGPGDHNYEREPISKVQESIIRLEIEALKKNR